EYVYMNQYHRDLFDIADDTDIAGKRAADLHSAEVAEKFQQNDKRVYETREQVEIEEVIQTDDGRQYFLTRIVPLFDNGSVYATCGIATNITEQKEYEEKL
ncbi:PAS domain-containing protein, partial [Halorubrum sp. GN12_10-3_MGM]